MENKYKAREADPVMLMLADDLAKANSEVKRLRVAMGEIFELAKHDGESRYLDKCYVVARHALGK